MKLHRFFVPDTPLIQTIWLQRPELLHQWQAVLRFRPGQKVVLFDGIGKEKMYELVILDKREAKLVHITDLVIKKPRREVTLLWALLTKDKNDWVLQKGTELGVSHFVPLITDRITKTGFNAARSQKILIEAAEQCGRSDIPTLREPLALKTAIVELKDKMELYICEEASNGTLELTDSMGVCVGPEGGWSDSEKAFFADQGIKHLDLHVFTLRAETAAVVAALKLLQ